MEDLMVKYFVSFLGNGILKTPEVIEAMKQVDRGSFAKYNAYADSPQSIGYAVTISAPHMVNTKSSLSQIISPWLTRS